LLIVNMFRFLLVSIWFVNDLSLSNNFISIAYSLISRTAKTGECQNLKKNLYFTFLILL